MPRLPAATAAIVILVAACGGTPAAATPGSAAPIAAARTASPTAAPTATPRPTPTPTPTPSPSPSGLGLVLATMDQAGTLRQSGPLDLPLYPESIQGVWTLEGTKNFGGGGPLPPGLVKEGKIDADGRRIMKITIGVKDPDPMQLWIVQNEDGTARSAALRVPSGGGGGESGYLYANLLAIQFIDTFAFSATDSDVWGDLELPEDNTASRAGLDRTATADRWTFRYVGTASDGDFLIVSDSGAP